MRKQNRALYWKWIKRTVEIAGGIIIFCIIVSKLNFMYVHDENYNRIFWHNFYKDNGKIDNLYLGSSHVYCDINPIQLDEMNGQYNFNMATPGQPLNGAYYLLREAGKKNSISHVYLELYYDCMMASPVDNDLNWYNIEFMQDSLLKLEYRISSASVERQINTWMPFTRYRFYLDDWDYIAKNMEGKNSDAYKSYQFSESYEDGNGYREYQERGFYYNTRVYRDEDRVHYSIQGNDLGENSIGDKNEEYLRKIIAYCQKNDIPLTFFISPMYELTLISRGGYDNYIAQVRKIAQEYGIEFYDFNLTKEEYLPIQQTKYYRDIDHLNYEGACMFTAFFHEVMSGNALENEKYFYNSYEEKLQSQQPTVYGLCYSEAEINQEYQEEMRIYWIASNREEGMEYRIIITPEEGEQYMEQDFAENNSFVIPAEMSGTCTIVARMKAVPDEVWTEEFMVWGKQ